MLDDNKKIEIYGIYVQTITATEQRRQNASAIYFTLVSAAVAYWGVNQNIDPLILLLPVVIGSLLWFLKLLHFRALARAKFNVIGEIEKDFSIKPFEIEWQKFKEDGNLLTRFSLTRLEMAIPLIIFIFGMLYLLVRALRWACAAYS
jgi:Na+-transporting methylmalonyl-CoA/oxaloacetate decarboxylase beta subunit